jgi:hypothetical protein
MEDSPGARPGRSETTGNAGRIPDDADQLSSAEPIFATQSSGKSGATFAHWEPKPEAERLPEDATYSSSTPRASRS